MTAAPAFLLFIVSNLLVLGVGGVLTALSFAAFRRSSRNAAFRSAAAGFFLITLGTLIDPIYELGTRGIYHLSRSELLLLHSFKGLLIAAGLGGLFYSLRQH